MQVISNDIQLRVARIRDHVTIFDIFDKMGVSEPADTHQMKCPFHADSSPSARVYADQNKLYCWTCGKGWDVIEAVVDHFKLTFTDALHWLEQEFGVPGVIQTLGGSIRTQLASRVAPNVQEVAKGIEAMLRQRRAALGFERYTRCLLALDVTVYEASLKPMKADILQARLTAIMQAAA